MCGSVSLRRVGEKRHRYGWVASSGSVVAWDPVNAIDPTGENGCPVGAAAGSVAGPGGAAVGCVVGAGATIVVGACAANQECSQAAGAVAGAVVEGVVRGAGAVRDFVGNILNNDNADAPPLPEDFVGVQDGRGGRDRDRGRMSGPLDPDRGGTGNADDDFGVLGGPNAGPPPDGSTLPPGSRVAPNGVQIRPGSRGAGPRIDIPANGTKPPETLHYPPRPRQ